MSSLRSYYGSRSATSAKSSANGSRVEGHSRQILDNRTWTSVKKINTEYWKTVLILSVAALGLVGIVGGVLGIQISKSNKDSPSTSQEIQQSLIPTTQSSSQLPSSPESSATPNSVAIPSTLTSTSSTTYPESTNTPTPTPAPTNEATAGRKGTLTSSVIGNQKLPGDLCTKNDDCQAPNVCYPYSQASQCCGTTRWGCPGYPCTDYNGCLDPYACVAGSCCGYPPYTILGKVNGDGTCYTASPTITTSN